ncbi:MAG TPA: YihY/virulence factor BrkB family protein [Vicinamibacterales bacterium]|nr:YihY/virulence factor BrkB family protein [Vicinamibacterales bacterium]
MFTYFRPPIAWTEVARRTIREINDDNCFGLAAQLAFYFLLALFPALLFLVALIGYVPIDDALDELLAALGTVAPRELVELMRIQLADIAAGQHAGLLTLGIAGALWTSSAALVAIIDALNRAYDVTEWRTWWKRRLLAIALTIGLAFFILVATTLVLVGPDLAARIASWVDLAPVVTTVWALLRWPVLLLCVIAGVDLVFHFAPNRKARWVWLTPGSLVATSLWIVSSFAFKFYVTNFGNYTATYGAIGAVIIAMLWFYVSSLAILVGAELNGVIEQAQAQRESAGASSGRASQAE